MDIVTGELRLAFVAALTAMVGISCTSNGGATGGSRDVGTDDGGIRDLRPSDSYEVGPGDLANGFDVLDALPDCFPDCIKALRTNCERPRIGEGSCEFGSVGGFAAYCYSNGVREIVEDNIDGGVLYVVTERDSLNPCYQVLVDSSTGIQHYQTPEGNEVAQVSSLGGGRYGVTCDGTTQTVDTTDPSCATVSSANCSSTVAVCP